MDDHIRRETEMNVCERPPITQEIKGGEKSICWSCFHWEVCFAKENQPCVKCTRYICAAGGAGKWLLDTVYPSGVKKFRCSICGYDRTVHERYEGVFRLNFCPNCGADMREV